MSMEIWVFNFDQKDLPTFSLKSLEEESLMVSYQNDPQLIVDLDQFASTKNLSERKLNQRDICDKILSENSGIKKDVCEFCNKRVKCYLVEHRRICAYWRKTTSLLIL